MTAAEHTEFDGRRGAAPPRYINAATEELGVLAKTFEDLQDSRLRATQRGMDDISDELRRIEDKVSRQMGKRLRSHELWPFLAPLKGLAGPLTARAVSMIQDPWRFPGQPCTNGHILRPIFRVGVPCPVAADIAGEIEALDGGDTPTVSASEIDTPTGGGDSSGTTGPRFEIDSSGGGAGPFETSGTADDQGEIDRGNGGAGPSSPTAENPTEFESPFGCGGVLLPPRTGTGVRSIWHYAGLHATARGKLPKRRKGVVADWKPDLRTVCLQPHGLADQIVLQRTPRYRDIYNEKKAAKLLAEYPPWRADKVAKTVAVKAFLGDLLTEWKRVTS